MKYTINNHKHIYCNDETNMPWCDLCGLLKSTIEGQEIEGQEKEPMRKIVAIFGYPMDNSVRTEVFDDFEAVLDEARKWKEIKYLVVAFETTGKILTYEESLASQNNHLKT